MPRVSHRNRIKQEKSKKERVDHLSVETFGRLAFIVSSRGRNGQVHIVDIEERFCSCEKFLIRKEVCHHIEAVLKHCRSLLDQMES